MFQNPLTPLQCHVTGDVCCKWAELWWQARHRSSHACSLLPSCPPEGFWEKHYLPLLYSLELPGCPMHLFLDFSCFFLVFSIRNSAGYGGIFMSKNREKPGLPDTFLVLNCVFFKYLFFWEVCVHVRCNLKLFSYSFLVWSGVPWNVLFRFQV